jgi:hypothetical protein
MAHVALLMELDVCCEQVSVEPTPPPLQHHQVLQWSGIVTAMLQARDFCVQPVGEASGQATLSMRCGPHTVACSIPDFQYGEEGGTTASLGECWGLTGLRAHCLAWAPVQH